MTPQDTKWKQHHQICKQTGVHVIEEDVLDGAGLGNFGTQDQMSTSVSGNSPFRSYIPKI